MHVFTLDYETYYDKDYSLRKMTPAEYILDPRFECIGCAVDNQKGLKVWLEPDQLAAFFAKLGSQPTMFISHNALFDMPLTAWRFGYVPTLMVDTMALARAWLAPFLRRYSLEHVAEYLGIGAKGNTIHKVSGMNREAMKAAGIYEEYTRYSLNDAELCTGIFKTIMSQGFPLPELVIMDMVLRMAVEPRLVLDPLILHEHYAEVLAAKQNLLDRVGMTKEELRSNERFALALTRLGIDPPMKISPTTGQETYAFAKTDIEFMDLEEHENPDVQALVAARLGSKSTLEESRSQRLINISQCWWPGKGEAALMPFPLRYSGAHTHRLSGDWKINTQNFTRGGKLRKAVKAPPGHKVLVADASQIEARMVAWFCGCTVLVDAFAAGADVYSMFASKVFGRTITKADFNERFVGKQAILGLGYGLGWVKFIKRLTTDALKMTGKAIRLEDVEGQRIVNIYRGEYREIPAVWRWLNNMIPQMTRQDCYVEYGPITFMHEKIRLPNGLYLYYHNLRNIGGEWFFTYSGKAKRIYGGKMLENIIQALARIATMDAAARCRPQFQPYKVHLALQAHDELGYCVPDEYVDVCRPILMREMRVRPVWAPGLPLDAESGVGQTYGSAK